MKDSAFEERSGRIEMKWSRVKFKRLHALQPLIKDSILYAIFYQTPAPEFLKLGVRFILS